MPALRLTGGAYQARSVIAAAQRQLNLYSEPVPHAEGEDAPVTLYPTPGLRLLATLPRAPIRGVHVAANGALYVVAGAGVYKVSPGWAATELGTITEGIETPVSMADNGLQLVVVDGTAGGGWQVRLSDSRFAPLVPADPQAYRYWRIGAVSSLDGTHIGLAQVVLLQGGADQVGHGTASASDPLPKFPAANAVDGNINTYWASFAKSAYWQYDFGEGEHRVIDTIRMTARVGSGCAQAPRDFVLSCSNDGTNWFTAATETRQEWTSGEIRPYATTVPVFESTFTGATRVDYLDTYFVLSKPGTPQFQVTQSLSVEFDPLWFANKQSYGDLLQSVIVAKREIWLLGTATTEIWYNAGAPDFPFQIMAGVFIDRGCVAVHSVAEMDNAVYWLAADRYGQGIVMEGAGYQAKRISTYAIEAEMATYATIADCVGYTYQLAGHLFYVLNFPTADKSWAYDVTTQLWHELAWLDANGNEHRHRANCAALAYGAVVAGDWQTGALYALDLAAATDNGRMIKRVRSFPHGIAAGKRAFYRQVIADMSVADAWPGAGIPVSSSAERPFGLVSLTASTVRPDPGPQVGVNLVSPIGAGFGAFLTGLTISMWLCQGMLIYPGMRIISGPDDDNGVDIQITPWFTNFRVFHGAGSAGYWGYVTPPPATPALTHMLMSLDCASQQMRLYVNDVAMVPDSDWVAQPDHGIANGARVWNVRVQPDEDEPLETVGIGDLWVTDAALDISDVAVRRKFIAADGSPVSLGADGSGPTGAAPGVYLHRETADPPAVFASNAGTGGAWSVVNGPLLADTACGTGSSSTTSGAEQAGLPGGRVYLDWSDDRGVSFGNPVGRSLGEAGEYRTSLQWQRLGMARDRVFRLTWTGQAVLQGAWIEAAAGGS